ncbi:FixH family protein [Falsiroseomonas tokyonensis]|uniref:FixH family protein n=1 Tax=Falsiroseomonas tokyonensis TaxID=430521 RepID=A0ABV7BWC8_9PROT|nr:FixH family protein [Falsiroseomonas tokyonensis]MBU8538348.1 FixH family protein [Falsiroseomonas tokyonensis]
MNEVAVTVDPRRSRWIPWVFVGGMLLVVVVNGGLIWAALSTFTGVTVGKSYDRGRTYNHVLQTAARQQALGWQAEVTLRAGTLVVSVTDRQGLSVDGVLEGLLQRPLEAVQQPLTFRQTRGGQFESSTGVLRPGQWEARLLLHGPGGQTFDIRRRVLAP